MGSIGNRREIDIENPTFEPLIDPTSGEVLVDGEDICLTMKNSA